MTSTEKDALRRRAQDCLVKAAAALVVGSVDDVAFAMLETGQAMLLIAELEGSGSAKKRVDEYLAAVNNPSALRHSPAPSPLIPHIPLRDAP